MKNEGLMMADKKIALGVVRRIGVTSLAWLALASHASAADSLCAPTEQVFFNCRIKDSPKLLSVCGQSGEEVRRGAAGPGDYLQYRFGLQKQGKAHLTSSGSQPSTFAPLHTKAIN